jgi:hypothetical protein
MSFQSCVLIPTEEDAVNQSIAWEIDADTMNLHLTLKDCVVKVCLRGVLHETGLIHAISHTPTRTFRVSKEGKFSGIDAILKSGKVKSVDEALKMHASSLEQKKARKRTRPPMQSGRNLLDTEIEAEEVEFVEEKTRSQRDEEGKAGAIDVEDESK